MRQWQGRWVGWVRVHLAAAWCWGIAIPCSESAAPGQCSGPTGQWLFDTCFSYQGHAQGVFTSLSCCQLLNVDTACRLPPLAACERPACCQRVLLQRLRGLPQQLMTQASLTRHDQWLLKKGMRDAAAVVLCTSVTCSCCHGQGIQPSQGRILGVQELKQQASTPALRPAGRRGAAVELLLPWRLPQGLIHGAARDKHRGVGP